MGIESSFWDSLAPIELLNSAPNLRIDRCPMLGQPEVLFLLGFK